ncbi:MAG: proton-conducting transporter membrane subunit [Bacteroidia bacterium]
MATADFIVLFASLVGFSLAIYTFVLSDYKKHISREASVKYFYLSAISVSLILFAAALNYLVFETTSFDATSTSIKALVHSEHFPTELMFVMLAFFTFGFFFKLAAYPGHL